MDFNLNEYQIEIEKKARELAETYLLPTVIERDKEGIYPREAYEKLGELGFLGLPYAKEYGGSGAGYLEYALAVKEISKVEAGLGISFSVSTSLYCGPIYNFGNEFQKKKYLEPVLSGRSLGAFGLTEPNAGSDASGVITTARREGDFYILNGAKCFTTNGPLADYYFVIASTNPDLKTKGLSAFIVEKDFPGVIVGKLEDKMGIRSAQVSDMFFEDVKVPVENLVLEEGKGFMLAMKALDGGRIGVASQALGIAEGAFDIARQYLKDREQFGKPLFKNQYLAFKMAELEIKLDQARLMLFKATLDKDQGRDYSISAAKAKYVCTNIAMEMTTNAVQMLGGNGYMKDYHVERMMRDAKITQIYEGTNEIQQLIVSGNIFK